MWYHALDFQILTMYSINIYVWFPSLWLKIITILGHHMIMIVKMTTINNSHNLKVIIVIVLMVMMAMIIITSPLSSSAVWIIRISITSPRTFQAIREIQVEWKCITDGYADRLSHQGRNQPDTEVPMFNLVKLFIDQMFICKMMII